jgi:hypothetical protein
MYFEIGMSKGCNFSLEFELDRSEQQRHFRIAEDSLVLDLIAAAGMWPCCTAHDLPEEQTRSETQALSWHACRHR